MTSVYQIPGMGKDDTMCGVVRTVIVCSSNPTHFRKLVKYSCDDSQCPTCYQDLIKRDALSIQNHLQQARAELRRKGLDPGHPYHFWISPPPQLHHKPLNELRAKALKLLQELGCIGGYIFDHPYRFQDKYRQIEEFRKGKIDKPYSPHFHGIVFLPTGFPLEKSNDFHARTGWTYGNEGNTNRKRTLPRNIFETAKYELSHVAIEPWHRHRLFKSFGIMHPSKMKSAASKIREVVTCPRCGADVHRLDPDTGEILGVAHRRVDPQLELRILAIPWLIKRWPKLSDLIKPVHLTLTELCQLEGDP